MLQAIDKLPTAQVYRYPNRVLERQRGPSRKSRRTQVVLERLLRLAPAAQEYRCVVERDRVEGVTRNQRFIRGERFLLVALGSVCVVRRNGELLFVLPQPVRVSECLGCG